ncbi:hypothetical protein [Bartonella apis]|nr:hypothetical protein [Bartonella apis]
MKEGANYSRLGDEVQVISSSSTLSACPDRDSIEVYLETEMTSA